MAAPASQRHGERALCEIILAVAAGVAAFVVTAVVSTVARSTVPEVLFGAGLLVGVVVIARRAGIVFALPVGRHDRGVPTGAASAETTA
jgi:hypothetical protein